MRASTWRSASSRARRSASACALLASVARASASWTCASASWTAASAAALDVAGLGSGRLSRRSISARASASSPRRRSVSGSGPASSPSGLRRELGSHPLLGLGARGLHGLRLSRVGLLARRVKLLAQPVRGGGPALVLGLGEPLVDLGGVDQLLLGGGAGGVVVLEVPEPLLGPRGPQLRLLGAALGLARAALGLGQAPLDGLELSRRLLLRPLQVLLEREDLVQRPVLGPLRGGLGREPDPLRDVAVGLVAVRVVGLQLGGVGRLVGALGRFGLELARLAPFVLDFGARLELLVGGLVGLLDRGLGRAGPSLGGLLAEEPSTTRCHLPRNSTEDLSAFRRFPSCGFRPSSEPESRHPGLDRRTVADQDRGR